VGEVDRDWLWSALAQQYWAKYRTREMFDMQLDGSWRIVSAFAESRMVGFCRVFSDGAAAAYLAYVYVAEDVHGRGVAQGLLRTMIDEGPGRDFRWMLHTAAAHGLYAKLGAVLGFFVGLAPGIAVTYPLTGLAPICRPR
jgi:GNAT superfamily N-acetyltransferase